MSSVQIHNPVFRRIEEEFNGFSNQLGQLGETELPRVETVNFDLDELARNAQKLASADDKENLPYIMNSAKTALPGERKSSILEKMDASIAAMQEVIKPEWASTKLKELQDRFSSQINTTVESLKTLLPKLQDFRKVAAGEV